MDKLEFRTRHGALCPVADQGGGQVWLYAAALA